MSEALERITRDGDPATVLDALRWIVADPLLGPELAGAIDTLIAQGGHCQSEAVAAADAAKLCIGFYLDRKEAA